MEVTRTVDYGDVFVKSKFAVQCNSNDSKCRADWHRNTGDRDSLRLVKLCNLLTRVSDDGFCLGLVEKKIVSDVPSGDCIGTCRRVSPVQFWLRRVDDCVQLCVVGELVVPYSKCGDEVAERCREDGE